MPPPPKVEFKSTPYREGDWNSQEVLGVVLSAVQKREKVLQDFCVDALELLNQAKISKANRAKLKELEAIARQYHLERVDRES